MVRFASSAWKSTAHTSKKLWLGLLLTTAVGGCSTSHGRMANEFGQWQYRRGNYAAARADFQRAMSEDPDNADYTHNLAVAMNQQGDLAAAEQTLRRALYVRPDHQPSYHSLAGLLNTQGRTAEAQTLLQTWTAIQPDSPAPYIEQAWLARETGQFAEAEGALQLALGKQPNHPVALAQMAQMHEETGRPESAINLYQRSLASQWNQPAVQSRLAALQPASPRFANGMPSQFASSQFTMDGEPQFSGQNPVAWAPLGPSQYAGPPVVAQSPWMPSVPMTATLPPGGTFSPLPMTAGVPVQPPSPAAARTATAVPTPAKAQYVPTLAEPVQEVPQALPETTALPMPDAGWSPSAAAIAPVSASADADPAHPLDQGATPPEVPAKL